jgi:amidase
MAGLLRRRQISSQELVEAHLRRIERANPSLNAIVTLDAEGARKRARALDEQLARGEIAGPLHGLPVAHKDLHETRGMRTTYGSPLFARHVPDADCLVVERMRRAGAVTLGKTNTPEFGAGSQTFNPVFGATRNPYDRTKTCGGSSGGAAVALAAGMIALADGSDMGGSLRNPASFCGVVGLRPSPGRVPQWPVASIWDPLNVAGPMARNTGDTALLLSAIAGPDARSPLSLCEAGEAFGGPLDRDCRGMRIAWYRNLGGVPFDRQVREVVERQREVFLSLGCVVEEDEPDFRGAEKVFRAFRALAFQAALGAVTSEQKKQVKETVLEELERAAALTGREIAEADRLRAELYQRGRQFFERYDFFVLPTVQAQPFDINRPYVTEIDGVKLDSYIDWMKSCWYLSVLAVPAISAPCGAAPDGLPVGLQIAGAHGNDWGVLQIAHAFEQACPTRPLPPVVGG